MGTEKRLEEIKKQWGLPEPGLDSSDCAREQMNYVLKCVDSLRAELKVARKTALEEFEKAAIAAVFEKWSVPELGRRVLTPTGKMAVIMIKAGASGRNQEEADPRFRRGDVVITNDGRKVTVTEVSQGDGKGWAHLWHDDGEGDGKSHGGGDIRGYRLSEAQETP